MLFPVQACVSISYLPIVVGRFAGGQHVARTDGVRTHCGGVAFADSSHKVHECPVLQPLARQYAALVSTDPNATRSSFAQHITQVLSFVLGFS